jgi:hypothetical protein
MILSVYTTVVNICTTGNIMKKKQNFAHDIYCCGNHLVFKKKSQSFFEHQIEFFFLNGTVASTLETKSKFLLYLFFIVFDYFF